MSETRRPALQSNLNIKNIGKSITSLTKGVQSSQKIAESINQQQKKRGNFLRSLTRSDSSFFSKRQENIKRKNREDEIEASDVTQGTLKQQGSAQSRSGRGFLGRILDILGIVIVGWFTTKLLPILPTLTLLVKLMGGVLNVGRMFTDTISEFVVSIEEGITGAFSKMKKVEIEDQANKATKELENVGNSFQRMQIDFQQFTNVIQEKNTGFQALLLNEDGSSMMPNIGTGEKQDMLEEGFGLTSDGEQTSDGEKESKATKEFQTDRKDLTPVSSSMLRDDPNKILDQENQKDQFVQPQQQLLDASLSKQFKDNLGDVKEKSEEAENKFIRFFKNIFGIDVKGNEDQKQKEETDQGDASNIVNESKKMASALETAVEKINDESDDNQFDLEPQGEGSGFVDISGMFDPVGTSNNKTEFGPGEFDNKIVVTSNPDDFSSLRLDEDIAEEIKVDRKKDKVIIVQQKSEDLPSGGVVNMSSGGGGGTTIIQNNKNDMKKIQSVILNA